MNFLEILEPHEKTKQQTSSGVSQTKVYKSNEYRWYQPIASGNILVSYKRNPTNVSVNIRLFAVVDKRYPTNQPTTQQPNRKDRFVTLKKFFKLMKYRNNRGTILQLQFRTFLVWILKSTDNIVNKYPSAFVILITFTNDYYQFKVIF